MTPGLPEDQASLPSDIKETIEKWQTMHLRSAIALWNNKAIRQSFPELIPILEQIHTMSWVSNLVRYHVLERCGGIYLDTDIVPLQSLWQLRQARFGPAFSVCENPNNLQIRHSLDGYIIDRRLRTCQQRCDWRYGPSSCFSSGHQRGYDQHGTRTEHESWRTVQTENIGPPVWTKAVRDHNVKVLHASLFFPCSWDNKHD